MEHVPQAAGSLPAARCAESNVCADHKPRGCRAIYKARIHVEEQIDGGESESLKNNSESKESTWGRAASRSEPSLCTAGMGWSDVRGFPRSVAAAFLSLVGLQACRGPAASQKQCK